jgi:hypothetical protein
MDQLHQQVARAHRRLILEQFLRRLVWCLLAALTIAAIAVALPRVVALATIPPNWDAAWLFATVVAGFLVAAAWSLVSRRSQLDAAIEIDRRFGLCERVASSLSLSPRDQSSDVGRAVVNDAMQAVSRINVSDGFRPQLDRSAWWPLVPAMIVFALVAFVDRRAESRVDPNSVANVEMQVKQSAESFRKKIEQRRKQAREKGLEEAEGLFKQIERGTRELTEKQNIDRTTAAVKLNELAKQLEARKAQLGGKNGLKEQFQNMKNLGAGPAEKAAQAMTQGDWKMALEEVEKMAQDLRDGKIGDDAKQQLAKQLEQIKQKLEAAAGARQQAMDGLKKQIQREQEQGNIAQAGELQQKLDQLQQGQQQTDRLVQMAQQISQIQQRLQQGEAQQAADAMAQMAQQLDQMRQEMNELEMLDEAISQLEMAKDALACAECQGAGCEACQGGMAKLGAGKNSGPGIGRGRGNAAPDEKTETNLHDTRVRQKPGQGSAVFRGMVEGPNLKGQVTQSIQDEMKTLAAEPADPLTSERLPNSRRQHAEQYFQMLREGP